MVPNPASCPMQKASSAAGGWEAWSAKERRGYVDEFGGRTVHIGLLQLLQILDVTLVPRLQGVGAVSQVGRLENVGGMITPETRERREKNQPRGKRVDAGPRWD